MGKKINFNHKEDTLPVSEICWNCQHFDGDNPTARKCSAFPNGIPNEIWNGTNNHSEAYPGDGGIRFEPIQIKRAA